MKKIKIIIFCSMLMISVFTGCQQPAQDVEDKKAEVNGPVPGFEKTFTIVTMNFNFHYVPPKTCFTKADDSETFAVSSAYWIGETEVTYELWYSVKLWAEDHGYTFANDGREGKDGSDGAIPTAERKYNPVTLINWRSAMVFCNALTECYNAHNGILSDLDCVYYTDSLFSAPIRTCDDSDVNSYGTPGSQDDPYVKSDAGGFRLPVNNEWELAARYINDINNDGDILDAGEYYPGNYASGAVSDYTSKIATDIVAWYSYNSDGTTHDAGTKNANALGIHDMSGNVMEWAFDWPPTSIGSRHRQWGGSYGGSNVSIGAVISNPPDYEQSSIGFRLAMSNL